MCGLCRRAAGNGEATDIHSADDTVLSWSPDSSPCSSASNRSDDFLGTLISVSLDGSGETKAGTDFGTYGCFSTGRQGRLPSIRKGQRIGERAIAVSYQN